MLFSRSRDKNTAPQQKVAYGYDAFNNLIGRQLDSNGDGTTDQSGYFIYDNGQILLQLDDAGSVDQRLLWGSGVDQILADENAAGDVLWALTDHQNTIRDWVQYDDVADDTSVVNHIAYNALGKITSQSNSSLDTLDLYYTGRFFDEATGLQYNTNRWYDTELGRWMSQDPIGFAAGDENLYRYVGNSHLNAVDPSGLAPPNAPMIPFVGASGAPTLYTAVKTKLAASEASDAKYAYYKLSFLKSLYSRLNFALDNHVEGIGENNWIVAMGGASAAWFDGPNYLQFETTVAAAKDVTLIHELVHATDDQNQWYLRNSGQHDYSSVERLGWATESLIDNLRQFRGLERDLKTGAYQNRIDKINGMIDLWDVEGAESELRSFERAINRSWTSAWIAINSVQYATYSFSAFGPLSFVQQSLPIGIAGINDVTNKLGVYVAYKNFEPEYQKMVDVYINSKIKKMPPCNTEIVLKRPKLSVLAPFFN